jgi:hypothetical protein
MKRFALIAALLAAVAVGSARAQVATTDLVPGTSRFFHTFTSDVNSGNIAPDNPAALAWGGPSRVAAVLTRVADTAVGPITYDFTGKLVGGRIVGSTFGFAYELQEFKEQAGAADLDDRNSEAQLSLKLGDWLGLGLGVSKPGLTSTALAIDRQVDRKEFGLSARLGESLYLGLARYQDTESYLGTFKRNGNLYGIALRTKGPTQWYLAVDVLDLPAFPGSTYGAEYKVTTLTAQMRSGSFLAGVATSKGDAVIAYPLFPSDSVKSTHLDLGWAPMAGLALTARISKVTVAGAALDEKVDSKSLAVAWQF